MFWVSKSMSWMAVHYHHHHRTWPSSFSSVSKTTIATHAPLRNKTTRISSTTWTIDARSRTSFTCSTASLSLSCPASSTPCSIPIAIESTWSIARVRSMRSRTACSIRAWARWPRRLASRASTIRLWMPSLCHYRHRQPRRRHRRHPQPAIHLTNCFNHHNRRRLNHHQHQQQQR